MAKFPWERLPLASLALTVVAVIEAAQLFKLDYKHRNATSRRETIWVTHFRRHLDQKLRKLPAPFGNEYACGVQQSPLALNGDSFLLSDRMLYSLAEHLGLLQDTVHAQELHVPVPLVPGAIDCPTANCTGCLRKESEHGKAWVFDSVSAYETPVYTGTCNICKIDVYPDRYIKDREEHYFPNPPVLQIGRGKYARQSLGKNLTSHVYHAHIPLFTFGKHWTATHAPYNPITRKPEITLQPYNLWRLFILYNIPTISGSSLIIPALTEELLAEYEDDPDAPNNRGDVLLNTSLAVFPQIPHGSYYTYIVPNTSDHRCSECSHFHRKFPSEQGKEEWSDEQLLQAHKSVITDRSKIIQAIVIDGNENLGHKICSVSGCPAPLLDYREGRFCSNHLEYEGKCGVAGCLQDALDTMPACEEHRELYQEFESRFGRDRSRTLHAGQRRMKRVLQIQAGEAEALPWEPPVERWHPEVQHYWQARHIIGLTTVPYTDMAVYRIRSYG
ncbi:hypothetical protein M422DRAFT_255115 [Sphaerobolus stellatus SS14]|uniref:CxC5 like cysteine cluster associated with KDZ domain-containing protein n=1 Tax=Sphaerobolus stellatus (strain SS14) TaxID=990650 RepID=A0A0C9VUA7_SPHS4|nr:hypothetical protein M422DRAFT_255115 [Sphaerobolus stellatus SS14]